MIEITSVANATLFIKQRGNKIEIADWPFKDAEHFIGGSVLRIRSSGETRLRRKYKKLVLSAMADLKKGVHVGAFIKLEKVAKELESDREDI